VNSDRIPAVAFRSVVFSQWAYWSTLAVAAWSYWHLPHGSIRATLILTPILPALLVVAASYWIYQACDEYIRFRILYVTAITAIVLAASTFSYFVLELFSFPRLSMIVVNLLGWSVFNLLLLYVVFRSR
jgi:hypothetical protein